MFNRYLHLILSLAFATCSNEPIAAFEVRPIAGWDQQIFPSYVIATASIKSNLEDAETDSVLGDRRGMFGVSIEATSDDQLVEVAISCSDFFEPSTVSVRLPIKGKTYSVMPKIKYQYDRLSQCEHAIPTFVTFRVTTLEGVEELSATVTFHSIQSCPIFFRSQDRSIDTTFAIASYINIEHPYLDLLLREAIEFGIVDRFSGYKIKDRYSVIRQAYALWDLIVARDTRCSDLGTSGLGIDSIGTVRIRLLEETINSAQASSLDASILLVALLHKAGLDAVLVMEPDHCYVGLFLDATRERLLYLDPSLLGTESEEPEQVDPVLAKAIAEDDRDEYSWPCFVESVVQGQKRMKSTPEMFDGKPGNGYFFLDVTEARKLGILAIPFTSEEEFFAYSEYEFEEESEEE